MIGTILFWVIFGGVTGWVASIIMNTNQEKSILRTIIIGIIGSVTGGVVSRMFAGPGVTGFNLYSIVVAVVGAALVLFVVNTVERTSSRN